MLMAGHTYVVLLVILFTLLNILLLNMKQNKDMTAEEQIAYLAEKIMGWEKQYDKNVLGWFKPNQSVVVFGNWNPLEDHNHWRMVEERLLEEGKSKLFKFYMRNFDGKDHAIAADLPERAAYLIATHQSLST
jgi:hypothetical protein